MEEKIQAELASFLLTEQLAPQLIPADKMKIKAMKTVYEANESVLLDEIIWLASKFQGSEKGRDSISIQIDQKLSTYPE